MAEDNIQQQNSEENKNDKIWWYLLLGLLQDSTESKWTEYAKQLMYSNRFDLNFSILSGFWQINFAGFIPLTALFSGL